jgi:response regulator RpfG family c-di-GMP phosphodiesterase
LHFSQLYGTNWVHNINDRMPSASSTPAVIPVVVVEPHGDNRAMYKMFLELSGVETSAFDTAAAALEYLRIAPRPQAVVFDFVLPDMTALAFCNAMDAISGDGPAWRRIVVTGWRLSAADRDGLTRGGVTAIYEKPCHLDVLLSEFESPGRTPHPAPKSPSGRHQPKSG